ncbi:MAG: FtsQ-type POTRA domain-containing protein, partial [Oscillospiraceae bacterium]|nr:FtsQ-type POTRA domain-containing protein [Oscillospiraceae bacterium]
RRRATRGGMRRRRRRTRMFTALLVLVLVAGGALIAMNMLFKVSRFRVENPDKTQPANTGIYTQEEILKALDIQLGSSIFGFSKEGKAREAGALLPELETLEVLRSLPDTVVVRVEPAEETFCMETSNGWAVLSQSRKVMKVDGQRNWDLIMLEGLPVLLAQPGYMLELEEPTPEELEEGEQSHTAVLEEILGYMEEEGLIPRLTSIWLQDLGNMSFLYDNRIRVELGTTNSLEYKMQLAGYLLRNENGDALSESDTGTLDCSHITQSGEIRPVFSPDAPLPAPESQPEENGQG